MKRAAEPLHSGLLHGTLLLIDCILSSSRGSQTYAVRSLLKQTAASASNSQRLTNKWYSHYCCGCCRFLYLGTYEKEQDAARVWDLAALKSRGKDANINFALDMYLDSSGGIMALTKVSNRADTIDCASYALLQVSVTDSLLAVAFLSAAVHNTLLLANQQYGRRRCCCCCCCS
jgi:hypothetical protein